MSTHRPRVRPLDAFVERRGREPVLALRDPEGLFEGLLVASPALAVLLPLMDGTRDRAEIAEAWTARTGLPLRVVDLERVLTDLEQRCVLEGPTADGARAAACEAWRALPARPPACAGTSYPEGAAECRTFLDGHEAASGVDGLEGVEAVLAPHIDLRGGGPCHGAAARALRASPAEVFVVLGTAHAPLRRPYALTTHDFRTPAGVVRTDRDVVERLARRGGGGLLEEDLAHRAEHSVEFQALWLAHVRGGGDGSQAGTSSPPRIVPVLVGSIGRAIATRTPPERDGAVADFVAALRELRDELGTRLALVASVDFAHVGPRYGGESAVTREELAAVMAADGPLLEAAARADAGAWFRALAAERDARNVCGAAPTWTLLAAIEGTGLEGRLLRHDEWEIDAGSHVSFAAMSFSRRRAR
jgi:AmmeMemoRadiSam system protein B